MKINSIAVKIGSCISLVSCLASVNAGTISQDAGWYSFCVGNVGQGISDSNHTCWNQSIGLTSNTISFAASGKVELRVTDAFISGESFRVIIDGRSRITSPSVAWNATGVYDPNVAYADSRYSHGSWILDAGDHTVDIFALTTVSAGGGAAYVELVSAGIAPSNPVVNYDLKWWSAVYLDLFQRVQKDLVWIGDLISIGTGKSVAEVALNRLWKVTLERLTALTPDPRDDAALKLGKTLENIKRVAELFGGSSSAIAANAAVAMSKITVNATVDALAALLADPARSDFSTVRAVAAPLAISDLDSLLGVNSFVDGQVGLTKCSAGLLDGIQVALLAGERAWGAFNSADGNWLQAQNYAYGRGIEKANQAVDECAGVMKGLATGLVNLGIGDQDLASMDLSYGSLSSADISSLRDKLLLAGLFSAGEIDVALSYTLSNVDPQPDGRAFEVIDGYANELVALTSLPTSLSVPEPNGLWLVALAVTILFTLRWRLRRRNADAPFTLTVL